MRLQELKSKETVRNDEATEKRVRVFLQSSFYTLHGNWQWEMGTDYVFCSDVLFFPQDEAISTKAIFHPDDVGGLKEVLASGELITSFSFRIITTYGEVRMLTGENIAVAQELTADWQQQAVQTAAEDLEQKAAQAHLQLLKELDDRTSRFTVTGRWYYNSQTHETWYSDYVYQLHGFPAQGLNPHLHTFHPFVHPDDKAVVMEYTNKAFQEKMPLHLDYRILVGDTEKWVSYKAFWFYGERGEAILGGIFQDVTEQKRAEKELETFRNVVQFQRQQLAFDEQQVAFGHWQVALLTRKTTYSDQYYRIFGLKLQSLAPTITAFLNYVHPDDREKVEAANRRLMYEHALPDLEYRIVRNDGKIRHLVQKAKLVTVEDELVVMGIIQDVTVQRMLEKKVAEGADALQLRSWLAQQADEQVGMISWIMDLDENSITWSDSFTKLAGYFRQQPTNITEKTLFAMVHPHDLKLFQAQWRQAVEERQATSFNVRFLVRGAVEYRKAVFNVYSQAEKAYFIGTVQNSTAEQVLQQQLSQRVQLAESLAENTFNRVIITDIHNTILLWNRAAEEAYGLKRADAIGQNFFDVFPHLKTEEEMQAFHRVHRGEKVVQEAVLSVLGRGYYNLHLVPVYQDEKVSGILHIIQDVTAEVRLRNSLNERLQLIESLVEASVDRIIALDRNLNYLYWNKSAEDYYGITKEAVLGKNILEVFPALVNDPSYGEIRRALRGETVHIPASPETEVFFETDLIPIKDERGEIMSLLWMAHDLSNEWQLQKERLDALAQLKEQSYFLHRITETIPDMVSIMELPSRKLRYLNNVTFSFNGFDTEAMNARTREEQEALIHPDSMETLEAYFQQLSTASDDEIVSAEYRAKNDGGEWMWFHVRGKVFQRDSAGKVTQVLNAIENITGRKRAEEALHASKELLQSVFDASPNSIMLLKPLYDGNGGVEDFDIVMFNQYTQRTNRISDVEVIGKRYTELFPNTISTGIVDRFKEVVTTGREADWEYAYEAEGVVQGWFRSIAAKSGDLLLVTSENITERKRAEEQILQLKDEIAKRATDKYLTLFNSIDEGFYQCEVIFDEENNPIDILYLEENPAAVRMIGASIAGKTLKEINPAYEPYWYQIWGDVALTGGGRRLEQYSAPDEKWFDFYISKVGSKDSRQVAVVFQDITERKKAEAALQEVNARLTDVLESTTDAFYAVDADFNFTYVNSKAAQLWKRSPESLIGKHYWTEFPAAVGSESYHKHQEVLQSGKSVHYETLSPLVGIWIKVKIYPGKDGGLAVFFHDISERKRAEENLKNFAATLEQQVSERTKELQKNLAILQQAEDLAQMGSWEYEITTGKFNWSEGMYRLFGLSQGSRVQAEVYLDFAAEEDRAVAKRIVKHLKKHHQPFEETLQIKRGNEIRLLKITGSVVSDEQGKPQRIVGVDLDTTEQKQAEEKVKETQHWLQQTAQASPDAINVYDLHRKQPFFLNNCLASWLGSSSEELVRIGINGRLDIVHSDDRLRLLHFNEKIKAANDGQVLTLDYRLRKKDGTLLWVRNRAKVFQRDAKGGVTHILSILQDITEEKAAEQVLTALNASLEKKNAELESKNDEITSFAFVASHDLKEPLRKIHTFSDWLLTKETNLSENGRISLQKMTGAVKRLDQLIDDILALTKVHVDKERIKKVELQQVLERAKEEMQERLQSTGAIIESEDLPVINGMENPLLYLFKNLISNSIKFQDKDNVPLISIRWKRENEFLKISFTDNGIGVAPEYHKKIFEMFRRLHGRTEYEGTGMGLAICKKIMEKHGGKITVESEAGKGATFTCWFPAALSTV